MASFQEIAMNLLHGDHTARLISEGRVVAAVVLSHAVGSPRTTLVKGWVCDSYSFRTIEFLGANASAE